MAGIFGFNRLDILQSTLGEYPCCHPAVHICIHMASARTSCPVQTFADIQHSVLRHPRLLQEDTQATLWNGERTGAVRHNHSLLFLCLRIYYKDERGERLRVAEVCVLNSILRYKLLDTRSIS